ncbi:MAG: tetratricopeptide repeat protein [Isosphaeraceae bacterium]
MGIEMPETAVAARPRVSRGKQLWRWLLPLGVLAVGLLGAGGWRWSEASRYRAALAEAKVDIRAGRHTTAARKLNDLLTWKPACDEAFYLLGTCEQAKGHVEAAQKAWLRVPPGSPFWSQAILGLIELEVDRGRFAEAERLVENALQGRRLEGSDLPILLGPLYCRQGRLEEAKRVVESRWIHLRDQGEGASEKALTLVRLHIELDRKPVPVELIRSVVDEAHRRAPEDDRVWLGKARLAIRMHAYDEAARWLDDCSKWRPNDVAVWRARLDWALATNRLETVREALKHVPAATAAPAQVPRLAAWLAARQGDAAAESRALERVVGIDPADVPAHNRLIELALQQGHIERAEKLRRQAAEIHQLEALYNKRFDRNQPLRDAALMAGIAERLGRGFEARVFLTVAIAVDPGRDDLRRDLERLDQHAKAANREGRSLADAFASGVAGVERKNSE